MTVLLLKLILLLILFFFFFGHNYSSIGLVNNSFQIKCVAKCCFFFPSGLSLYIGFITLRLE